MNVNFNDVGSALNPKCAVQHNQAVAGGAGDGSYVNGIIFDLHSFQDRPTSALLDVLMTTTLASGKTLSLATKIEHGDAANLSDAATYAYDGAEVDHGVLATGVQTALSVCQKRSVDLRGIKRYFRVAVEQTLSATATDTSDLMAGLAFFSGDVEPD